MTKNNLREHLSWLLRSDSANTPHTSPTGSSSAVPITESSISRRTTPNANSYIESPRSDVTAQSSVSTPVSGFLKPDLPASLLRNQGNNAMARLQTAPKARNKSRLLSETLPIARLAASPSAVRKLDNSLAAQYNRGLSDSATTNGNNITPKDRPYAASIVTSVSQKQSNDVDPTTLDLSRDLGLQSSSSSTVETFGEPRPIWMEESASRKEPLTPRGRKRKSDELEIDELQREEPSRVSQSGFAAIDDFPDDFTSPRTTEIVSSKTKSLKGTFTHYPSRGERSPHSSAADSKLHQIKTDTSPNKHRPLNEIPLASVPEHSFKHSVKIKSPGELYDGRKLVLQSTPGHGGVADSEDDDEIDDEELRDAKHVLNESRWPPTTSPVKPSNHDLELPKSNTIEPLKDKIDDNATSTGSSKHGSTSRQDIKLQSASTASPFQHDSPTKLRDHPAAVQTLTLSSASPAPLSPRDKSMVRTFLSFRPNRTQAFLDELYSSRRAVAAEIYSIHLQGASVSADLGETPARLSAKIIAVERLLSLRDEHLQLEKEKEQRKARIIKAIELDIDTSLYQHDVDCNKRAVAKLSSMDAEIAILLIETDLPVTTSVQAKAEAHLESTTQVESTQAPLSLQATSHPSRQTSTMKVPATNYVQQTQSSQDRAGPLRRMINDRDSIQPPHTAPQTPEKPVHKKLNDDDSWRTPLRTYTSSAATKDVTAYFSPPKDRFSPSKRTDPGRLLAHGSPSPIREPSVDPAKSNQDFDDEENLFSTHMGNPYVDPYDNDDYGHADDDVDMLEVVEEMENQPPKPAAIRDDQVRPAFAETTGNIMRTETAKSAPAFESSSPKSSLLQHRWSRDVKAAMSQRFHLRGFRPFQLEAVNATLAGKDAFVLMPTGGGKSLCYQLPAIITSGKTQGVTVVVSPLLSLMQDQVEHLQKLRIQALLINGEVTAEHRRLIMGCLREDDPQKFCQLLYITPEMISKSQTMVNAFKNLHARGKLARIVIDEAHCVSQWGHDFRPDYKLLGEVRRQFRGVPLMALTATATENVKVDVMHNLGMSNCEIFTQSFNRPNLHYEVRSKGKGKDVLEGMAETINTIYKRQTGIIYCLSKKNCEDIAEKLRVNHNIMAHHYHAGMEPEEKKLVQKKWQAGHYNVIVATIAFGMGIDKPDVRFVFHHTIPKSLEGYYQETGRAGRDGKVSGCFLYYGYHDTSALKRMIDDGDGDYDQKERQRQMLRNVVQFCENRSDCRRVQVLNYFGEAFSKDKCNASCDNCKSKSRFESRDFSHYVPGALRLIGKVQDNNVTLLHCVDVFRGGKSRKIADFGHDRLPEYGAGSDIEKGDVERLFYRLVSEDAIAEHNVVNKGGFASNYVHLGKNSHAFSRGQRKVHLQVCLSPASKSIYPKTKSRKKPAAKSGTGVAAAHSDHPISTNVSSPVQAKSRRRYQQRLKETRVQNVDEDEYDTNDDFVVPDGDLEETCDESNDGFEPLREAGKPRKRSKRPLGPPILIDEQLDRLNIIHRAVVEDFFDHAKKKCTDIHIQNSSRELPFTDAVLRDMAIKFPESEAELLNIPGIASEQVRLYGHKFLPQIRAAKREYDAMMESENRPQDPNHMNVIDISSDDGNDPDLGQGADGSFSDEESQGERSQYFQPDKAVESLYAQLSQVQAQAPSRAQSISKNTQTEATHGGYKKARGSRKFSGRGRGRASSGASKKQAASTSSKSFSFGASGRGGPAGGNTNNGIGMMPM